jgi:hypothetical protein
MHKNILREKTLLHIMDAKFLDPNQAADLIF